MSAMNTHLLRVAMLLLTFWATAVAGAAGINAWLDRTRVAEGETVQLTLEAQGQVSGQPDTAPLAQDFDILGQSSGSRLSIVNGQTDARTSWTLTLSPKHGGTLTIPALRVGTAQSAPLTLQVTAAPAPQSGSDADISIETALSSSTPYVQGQVLYTMRLLYAVPVKAGQISEPAAEHALVQKLGDDRDYATTRHGRRYQVIERRYAVFPQSSGRLELAAPVFDGEVPDTSRRRTSAFSKFFGNDPFFGPDVFKDIMTPTRRVRVRGEPVALDVRPRPQASRGPHWLPAEQLTLNGSWQPDGGELHAGEPVTLVLDIKAQGLTGGQLPSLAPASVDGFDVYPDQAQRQTETQETGVTGHLQQKIAFIPRRDGALSVPAIEVHWWDTQADRERLARVPGRELQVLPATGRPAPAATASTAAAPATPAAPVVPKLPATAVPAAATPASHTTSPGPWPWISAVLAGGWLFTLACWWWRARGGRAAVPGERAAGSQPGDAGRARQRFHAACRDGDPTRAHRALLDWAAAHWPHDPPRGLQALARRLDDPATRAALADLDRAIYTPAISWDGAPLAGRLKALPKQESAADGQRTVLAPLYPETTRHSHA